MPKANTTTEVGSDRSLLNGSDSEKVFEIRVGAPSWGACPNFYAPSQDFQNANTGNDVICMPVDLDISKCFEAKAAKLGLSVESSSTKSPPVHGMPCFLQFHNWKRF